MDGALILPKGVIKNSSTINHSIEQFQTSPLDQEDIAKLWKVYTTTKRRLLDPTAERLENYWWRIWGSRSRNLKAVTVAQIFADISDGHSFVPLTSQANRDEGTPPSSYRPLRPGASITTTIHRASVSKLGTTPKQVDPPPSILKNSDSNKRARNSSQNGPKPTARFISPHESENESLAISPKNNVIVHPPSPTVQEPKGDKKLTAPTGKKKTFFVASGRGKRPVAIRRQSSQSSTDNPAKAGEVQIQSSADRTPPQFTDPACPKPRAQVLSQDGSSSSSGRNDKKVRKVKGQEGKYSSPRKPTPSDRANPRESPVEAGPSRESRAGGNGKGRSDDLTPEEMDELELQSLLLAEANARQHTHANSSTTPLTSAPNQYQRDLREISESVENPAEPRSQSPVKPASNSVLPVDMRAGSTEGLKGVDKGKGPGSVQTNGLFSKRPVQPLASTSVPDSASGLNRTKSQLTLLLEKDRAATNSNQRSASSIDLKRSKQG